MTRSNADWDMLFLSGLCKINEGNQGTILRVETTHHNMFKDVHPVARSIRESNMGTVPLIKAQKTPTLGSAEAEFVKQLQAYEIIASSSVANIVQVPMLWSIGCHRADIGDSELLYENTGLVGNNVEFFAMEEVKGLDLATFAYQQTLLEIIRCDTAEDYPRPEHALLYAILRYKLANMLRFNRTVNKSIRDQILKLAGQFRSAMRNVNYDFVQSWDERLNEEERTSIVAYCPIHSELALLRILHENPEHTLDTYLGSLIDINLLEQAIVDLRPECIAPKTAEERRRRFVDIVLAHVAYRGLLPETLCEVMREAIIALHRGKYYHCDLHERNLMISHDRKTLFLIDYEKSNRNGDTSEGSHNYRRYDGKGPDDFGILSPGGGLLYLLTRQCPD